jgi:plastocyanin
MLKKALKLSGQIKEILRNDVKRSNISPDNFEFSKLLATGESYSYTFYGKGDFYYSCSPHPTQMRAIVKVVD